MLGYWPHLHKEKSFETYPLIRASKSPGETRPGRKIIVEKINPVHILILQINELGAYGGMHVHYPFDPPFLRWSRGL